MTSLYDKPATPTDRARALRAENRRLRLELETYRQWAPDPETLAQLIQESQANRTLYQAVLARNVILNRRLREMTA